eukprot:TRINITY_DN7862_c0_g1_i1.p1 TRINITY_DN7862_c0_g1~~TRINITY_DN7862_c0_g1_i1.p1  ORF type:complete len:296 (-),score=97.71 TRINITY_DN7862_c0_g1_i1:65-916(-)
MASSKGYYVGLTGITSIEQATQLLQSFDSNPNPNKHRAMFGYLITNDTVSNGVCSESQKNKSRYPSIATLQSILDSYPVSPHPMNTIHFESDHQDLFGDQMIELFEKHLAKYYANGVCRAVQINIARPDLQQLDKVLSKFPELEIILQVRPEVLKTDGGSQRDSDAVVEILRPYADEIVSGRTQPRIRHLLIDPSCGAGIEFDPAFCSNLHEAFKKAFPLVDIGFAGGLSTKNVTSKIEQLRSATGTCEFSVDIETGVRTEADELVIEKSIEYFAKSLAALAK